MNLIEQLIQMARSELWQDRTISDQALKEYFYELIDGERIILHIEGGELIGFCEYSRINITQLGSLVLYQEVTPAMHDPAGEIIWINNLHIKPFSGSRGVLKYIHNELNRRNPYCRFICGQHQGKRLKPIAVFRKKVSENGY